MSLAYISHPSFLLHEMGETHPECPDRLRAIEAELKSSGLYDKLKHYQAPSASIDQLERVHDPNYIQFLLKNAPSHDYAMLDPDTLMNQYTLEAALHAAGANILAVDLILNEKAKSAFCCVRPPGHHAEHNSAMGFCFFNNIAVGVAHALENHKLDRVAIIDFDVHHGNGTEGIFKKDERVLLCSSFQHPFYPYSDANSDKHILNLPLPAGTKSLEFREKVAKYWFDSIIAFKPQMFFISAGFDAHREDILANLSLETEDYFWITQQIKKMAEELCNGRIVSTLEGGYALPVLGQCVVSHLNALR